MSRATPRAEHRLPGDYFMVPIPADVLDIGRRITEGDEMWRGDPTMGLYYHHEAEPHERFQVIGLDVRGEPYIAATGPAADHRLLEKLAAGDWQRGHKVLDEVIAHNDRVRAAALAQAQDRVDEAKDKLGWALKRDLGHLDGGNKGFWAINWDGAS